MPAGIGVLKLAGALGLGYVALTGGLYALQDRLVFPGSVLPSVPFEGPPEPERIDLEAADGTRLHGLLFVVPGATDLVIGFGGNAQDAEALAGHLLHRLAGRHLVVFHYRGYGRSAGRPSETALVADAVRIYDAMTARLSPARVFAIGVSLGSGVAVQLARQRALAGLLLITPFDSILAIARERYGWLPVTSLLKHPFDSASAIRAISLPVAVIAAGQDRVVRPARTEALTRATPNLVFSRTLEEAHHNSILSEPGYDEAFQDAMSALAEASAPPS